MANNESRSPIPTILGWSQSRDPKAPRWHLAVLGPGGDTVLACGRVLRYGVTPAQPLAIVGDDDIMCLSCRKTSARCHRAASLTARALLTRLPVRA